GFHLNGAREITLGDGGGDFGDGADLIGEVVGQQVHVAGEVLPCAGGAGHVGLSAEAAFDADLARDGGDLIGEGGERAGHIVNGFGERGDLALGVDGEFLGQLAVGDGGDDLYDTAHLFRQVGGHDVDVIGEVLPCSAHAGHLCLAAELAVGADLARDASDFRGEGVQLIDHGVDGVLELKDFALDVDGDLAGEVAASDGGRDLGDVANLSGQIGGHGVDRIGEVFPCAADAGDVGLTAETAVGTHLARDAGNFGGEGAQLLNHGVEGFFELQDLAAYVHGDLLRQVAVGDGGGDLGDVADLAGKVGGHEVDVVGEVLPGAGDAGHFGLAAELAVGADLAGNAGDLAGEGVELVDHRVDGVLELEDFAFHVDGDLAGEVAASDGG